METGYVWYDIGEYTIFNKNVLFSLCFYKGNLDSIIFGLDDPKLYGSSWDDWDEKKEKLRAAHTIKWLQSFGYKTGSFSWGEIWAYLDRKSGFGNGGVKYFP